MNNATLAKFHKALNTQTVKYIIDPKVSVAGKKSIRRTK